MASNDSRIIVVRAWRNAGRLIMRVIAAPGGTAASQQWVFSDANAATEKIAEILREFEYPTLSTNRRQDINIDSRDDDTF
jgi:hypothetical protein